VIGRLSGVVIDRGLDGVCVLDVAGVGYEVFVPLRSVARLPGPPEKVTLHVHTHAREDALLLYGFESGADRVVFRLLMGVSGVGPKLAMAVLSELSAADLRTAVATADKRRFAAISGVGKKTAERLVLELRDKLDLMGAASAVAFSPPQGAHMPAVLGSRSSEAVAALVGLGFSRLEAENAVAKAEQSLGESEEGAPLETLVRRALGALA